jgi:hypothetical protein
VHVVIPIFDFACLGSKNIPFISFLNQVCVGVAFGSAGQLSVAALRQCIVVFAVIIFGISQLIFCSIP